MAAGGEQARSIVQIAWRRSVDARSAPSFGVFWNWAGGLMYASAVDEKSSVMVWYPSDPTPAEWDAHFADVETCIGWSRRTGVRPAVLLLANEFARPDAKLRMRLAAITGHVDYDPYIAFVNSNAMLRGLLTVLGWMHTKPSYEIEYLASEEAGIAWLEQKRGMPLPQLRQLVAEVRVKALMPRAAAARREA
jgi:hypothetical protein